MRQNLFAGTGVTELRGRKCASLQVGESIVHFAGLPARWGQGEAEVDAAIAKLPEDGLHVLLYHFPDQPELAASRGVDLYMAGHTHGGQVSLPLYGGAHNAQPLRQEVRVGLYHVGDMALYVNRGIGMEGHDAPRRSLLQPGRRSR